MNKYNYETIIKSLNNYEIERMSFYVEGYAHYRNCEISVVFSPVRSLKIKLTNDKSEGGLCLRVPERYKLFRLGKQGSFTLKQIWEKICIIEIKYFEEGND